MKQFRIETTREKRRENTLQLKVCEACGSLWLRPAQAGVYCNACSHWLAEFPAPKSNRCRNTRTRLTLVRRCRQVNVLHAEAMATGGAR